MNNYNSPNSYTPNPQATNYALNAAGQSNRHGSNMSPAPNFRQNTGAQPNGYGSAHTPSLPQQRAPPPSNTTYTNQQNYKAPNPVEVYHLSDGANAQIPADIRAQFQCDEQGRVLWFTAPPLNTISIADEEQKNLSGHSVKYLAAKVRRDKLIAEKRKRDAEVEQEEAERAAKAAKSLKESNEKEFSKMRDKAMGLLESNMYQSCEANYKQLYGENWQEELAKAITGAGG